MDFEERAYIIAWWNVKHYLQVGCPIVGDQTFEDATRIVKEFEAKNPCVANQQRHDWGNFNIAPIYDKTDARPMKDKYYKATYGCKSRV